MYASSCRKARSSGGDRSDKWNPWRVRYVQVIECILELLIRIALVRVRLFIPSSLILVSSFLFLLSA